MKEKKHKTYKGMHYLDKNRLYKVFHDILNYSQKTRKLAITKYNILKKHNFMCIICNSTKYLTIDHINDDAKGNHGKLSTYKNKICTVLCVDCHIKKNMNSVYLNRYVIEDMANLLKLW